MLTQRVFGEFDYADRTSCHKWWANRFRLLLSSLAYNLFDHIRRIALQNTRLE